MKRRLIVAAGAMVSLGFLLASAAANYLFGASLGRTPWEAELYGAVGVLAVAMNALAPFYISWSLIARRRTTAAAIAGLWALCLAYSTSSALGFAAQNRDGTALVQQLSHDAYNDTRRELLDLEARRRTATAKDRPRLDARIDDARKRLAAARASNLAPADAQSRFLASLLTGWLTAAQVRDALVALFALMVEMCATLRLFAALSHASQAPAPAPPKDKPPAAPRTQHRWTPKPSAAA
jgi:hypothetical protein